MSLNPLIIPILIFSIPIVAIVAGSVTKVIEMRHKERMARGVMGEDDVASFHRTVERMEARMKALEAILDDEVPGWRRKYDD